MFNVWFNIVVFLNSLLLQSTNEGMIIFCSEDKILFATLIFSLQLLFASAVNCISVITVWLRLVYTKTFSFKKWPWHCWKPGFLLVIHGETFIASRYVNEQSIFVSFCQCVDFFAQFCDIAAACDITIAPDHYNLYCTLQKG